MSYIETSSLKNSTIMFLYAERERINMAPKYQRSGGVWTKQKKQLLIDSIINDYDLPKLYFHKISKEHADNLRYDFAVIDGRQRLEAIFDFIEGKIPLSLDIDYQRDEQIDLAGMTYDDLAKTYPKLRIMFDSFVLPVVQVDVDDLDLIEDMFSRLNEAVPLNAAEKRNAIGGSFVQQIRDTSNHNLFRSKVAFSNKRAQHKEIAARLLLTEHNLVTEKRLIDTKREFLDSIARNYKIDQEGIVKEIGIRVADTLDKFASVFSDGDELLRAQGNMVVFYLVFRAAAQTGAMKKLTRQAFQDFRARLAENRKTAEEDFTSSNFELLEYDRLSQQGTNDASNIRGRFRTLADHFGVNPVL